ncbi:hypothetical protein OV079_28620 [Nannocystis pusilla]|uniref:Uncharacterized protein n=1 Tax=Nannocystis pusilla TaxID=889268 RepID=A0A9X3ESM1_9BACT|nr:hypothetical protein [Nannocystis pusilla]MCY1009458.1 hypothetical protein [Nannocystis pusilla]
MRRLAVLAALLSACTIREPGNGSDGDVTSETSSETSTSTSTSTGEPTGGPPYERNCQPGDFVCDDWGCEGAAEAGECYKPCTPSDGIGGFDSECDEPERPFCSQVGRAFGGDFDCNGCAHVCLAEPINWCEYREDQCDA